MSDGKKLGNYLKKQREAKGRTVEEIAEALKITPINIMNIENGNIESIGLSEIFVRSYIKSYITELGESPDDVFNQFYEFQNEENTKIGKDLNASTMFYNPIILVTGVIVFFFLSYVFISYSVERNTSVIDITNVQKIEESLNENKEDITVKETPEDRGNFSDDYDSTYSNYSETTR